MLVRVKFPWLYRKFVTSKCLRIEWCCFPWQLWMMWWWQKIWQSVTAHMSVVTWFWQLNPQNDVKLYLCRVRSGDVRRTVYFTTKERWRRRAFWVEDSKDSYPHHPRKSFAFYTTHNLLELFGVSRSGGWLIIEEQRRHSQPTYTQHPTLHRPPTNVLMLGTHNLTQHTTHPTSPQPATQLTTDPSVPQTTGRFLHSSGLTYPIWFGSLKLDQNNCFPNLRIIWEQGYIRAARIACKSST